jgi:hypothetical protein
MQVASAQAVRSVQETCRAAQRLTARRGRGFLGCGFATVGAVFDIASRSPDYLLRWPRELFVLEAKSILAAVPTSTRDRSDWAGEVSLLLTEAYVADTPRNDFDSVARATVWQASPPEPQGTFGTPSRPRQPADPEREFLEELVALAPRLTEQHAPRPYYSQRSATAASTTRVIERDLDSACRFRPNTDL